MVEGTSNATLYQQSVCSTASQIPKVSLPGKVFYNFKLVKHKLDIFHAGFHTCYLHDHLWSRRGSTCAVFLYNKREFQASVLWNLLTSLTCPNGLAANNYLSWSLDLPQGETPQHSLTKTNKQTNKWLNLKLPTDLRIHQSAYMSQVVNVLF